ncbi:MAG: sensor histidine kinase [Rikenellaceae bacterium]
MGYNLINSKYRVFTLQLIGWGVILATSLFWSVSSESSVFDTFGLMMLSVNLSALLLIYVLNYILFIPRYLFNNKRTIFFIFNILLLALLLYLSFSFNKYGLLEAYRPDDYPAKPKAGLAFLTRDLINYVLMVGMVTALRLAEQLQKSEEALREAENARTKAELDNLKSQINPHFLLNTLNNIYALTAIDADRAQSTIKELSNLLRYILYDNRNDIVPIAGEVDFLKTYIQLMSIRLPLKMKVKTEFIVAQNSNTLIAPLIFISLVENAFKHSVNSSGEGFIDIYFEDKSEQGEVVLLIKNSNNSKKDSDKSGHGIGLEQVRRRLELLYKGHYKWVVTQDEQMYSSVLTIKV